jgi:glycosyltransferase involved in cell wall biosynthesis
MDIILTISLLASNRRESLERCLDSLKPLLVKIPSELIIVFTGTDEKVLKIAQKYTPQIITFEWCNDFSAARNIGLKAAQGEWFLYIDDDEWFDDVEQICQFFLSGEHKHYHSAHYIQRNYQDWFGTKYSDFSAFRMVRRIPEACFRGAIHEELTPRREPCKYFHTYVHHYGYAGNGENREGQKTARNIPLLLKAIQNSPGHVKNYMQTAKEFDLAGDWKKAEEYCQKGRAVCRKFGDTFSEGWLQAYLSGLLCKKSEKGEAILEIESMLKAEHPKELISLVLYQQLVHLCANGDEPEKAVWYGRRFEELLDYMEENPCLWVQQGYGEFCEDYIKAPDHLYGLRMDCSASGLKLKDQNTALFFLKRLPWEQGDILCRYYPEFERWKENYASSFWEIFSKLWSHEYICSDTAGSQSTRLPKSSEADNSLKDGSPVSVYLLFQKALYLMENDKPTEGKELFSHCLGHPDSYDTYLRQLFLKEAIGHQINMSLLAKQMDLAAWDRCTDKVIQELPYTLNSRIQVCELHLGKEYPLYSLCLKKYRLEQKLFKGFPLWEELIQTLEDYCLCIMEFYKGLYREEMFEGKNISCLPKECRFAATVLEALEKLEQMQMPEAVRLLSDAIHVKTDMWGVVTELFRQAARRMDDPALQAGDEFLNLAGQMKETLYTLLDAGQTAQASQILKQVLPLIPEELELIWIGQELIRRRKL